jgi:predicted RNA-binding Zn ribbon-like protein
MCAVNDLRFDPGRQPAGRAPAPGRLGLVQAFTNTFWDLDRHGADEWETAAAYGAWLTERGFDGAQATEQDRVTAIRLREALRDLARLNHDDADPASSPALRTLDELGRDAALAIRFDPHPRHEPQRPGPDGALALVLGVVAEAMAEGTWNRLKACPGPHCGWMFFDASRNRSSQWCSMRICGNRVKGREFRARRRAGA